MEVFRKGIKKCKKSIRANTTIQMAYIIPMFLLIFVLMLYILFYYHDKIILTGTAGETAVLGAQFERRSDKSEQVSLEEFCRKRSKNKLIMFSDFTIDISKGAEEVIVEISGKAKGMHLHIQQKAKIMDTEKRLRR